MNNPSRKKSSDPKWKKHQPLSWKHCCKAVASKYWLVRPGSGGGLVRAFTLNTITTEFHFLTDGRYVAILQRSSDNSVIYYELH